MKKLKYIKYAAIALSAATITSCSKLDEYNPSGASAEGVWTTPQGFVTAVNAAYYEQRYWYGKEDGLFLSECGTDLWFNAGKQNYANQLYRYEQLTPGLGANRNAWRQIWKGINQCNAGINRIDKAGFTDEGEKNRRLGELRFLRAFYYWHVVETWGGVMLRTTETDDVLLTATRSSVKDFYDLIVSDLEFAKEHLPNDWGNEYSRATKKSALGLLARACLTRAYYPDADANAWFTKARDVAKEVIDRKGEFNVDLWESYADLWLPKNNKKNKEALYTISNSSVTINANYDKDGNRLHHWFLAQYSNKPALTMDLAYGKDNERRNMPTRYLLDLFDETIDSRYEGSFQETWYNNTGQTFTWTTTTFTTWKDYKDSVVLKNSMTIPAGALALQISKGTIPDKKTVAHLAFDRDDVYKADGKIATSNHNFVQLKKFMDPSRTTPSSTHGYNDIFVIRLAEMYLIAGEAEYKLGNSVAAAGHFNDLRKRAAKPGRVADMTIDPSQINTTWILEERARELCGEFIRWFDLKRMLKGNDGADWVNHIKTANPDISAIANFHMLRPVPQDEMNALLNAKDFGQNFGY